MLSSFSMCSRWLDLWEGRSRSYRRTKNDPSDIGYNRELNGLSGLISHHYYLCGRGEVGKQYRLEVSADEFYELENIHEIIVDVIREQSGFWNFCNS